MKTFVKLSDQMVVEDSIVLADEHSSQGIGFLKDVLMLEGEWVEVVFDDKVPGSVAMIGATYEKASGRFITPSPFASWVLNKNTYTWEAPVSYPTDGLVYSWSEELTDWEPVVFESEQGELDA